MPPAHNSSYELIHRRHRQIHRRFWYFFGRPSYPRSLVSSFFPSSSHPLEVFWVCFLVLCHLPNDTEDPIPNALDSFPHKTLVISEHSGTAEPNLLLSMSCVISETCLLYRTLKKALRFILGLFQKCKESCIENAGRNFSHFLYSFKVLYHLIFIFETLYIQYLRYKLYWRIFRVSIRNYF